MLAQMRWGDGCSGTGYLIIRRMLIILHDVLFAFFFLSMNLFYSCYSRSFHSSYSSYDVIILMLNIRVRRVLVRR